MRRWLVGLVLAAVVAVPGAESRTPSELRQLQEEKRILVELMEHCLGGGTLTVNGVPEISCRPVNYKQKRGR